jgi:hypothetical protein
LDTQIVLQRDDQTIHLIARLPDVPHCRGESARVDHLDEPIEACEREDAEILLFGMAA